MPVVLLIEAAGATGCEGFAAIRFLDRLQQVT
jgi:hypothetical protein